MGYLIVLVFGVVLIGVLIVTLSKQGAGSMKGKLDEKRAAPVGRDAPSADEPTPGASRTSSSAKVQSADQHTPPA